MIKPPFRLCTQNTALYITAEKPPVQSDDHPNPEPIRTLIAKVWDEEHGKLIVRACNRDDVFDELVKAARIALRAVEKDLLPLLAKMATASPAVVKIYEDSPVFQGLIAQRDSIIAALAKAGAA